MISMEEVRLSGCLLIHLLPLFGLLLRISGRLGVGYNTPQSSHCEAFISIQLTSTYWLFRVSIHWCTWLNKNLYDQLCDWISPVSPTAM